MPIEIEELYSRDGLRARTVGGRQTVTIESRAATTVRDYYNPNAGADYRAGKARWKTHRVPAGFLVTHSRGRRFVRSYAQAVKVAVYHARHLPRD